ncbi:hypothetical protein ELAC_1395 [Estrella lausannensis]|uniref:Uncharacterized protein n=2 Tax=Estrella lausannensis TaxID=483423 RepID=A0A0H5DQ25_9BACT|nr:hypothetical protein ELAC_1395 [Estrella lausannensis]
MHQVNAPLNDFIEIPSYSWVVNNKEIKLFLRVESYFTVYENNNLIKRVDLTNDEARRIRATSQIYIHTLNNHENFDFCAVLFKKKFKQLKVSILYSRFGPLWQLYDRNTRETRWQRFSATFVSDACHRKTWDMFEKYKNEVQEDIRALKYFEDDFLIKDIVLFEKVETPQPLPFDIDLESLAKGEEKKAYDLKKARAWEKASTETRIDHVQKYSDGFIPLPLRVNNIQSYPDEIISDEDPGYLFVFGGTQKRARFEENESRFAIYNTIVRHNSIISDSRSQVLGYRQKSLIPSAIPALEIISMLFSSFFSSLVPQKNLIVSEKIKPIVETFFPFYIIIEPKTLPCTLDENVRVSKLRWAISLICDDTNASSGQHALVFIQGINDGSLSLMINHKPINIGERFTIISHLKSENEIEIKPIEESKLRFIERTQIWLLTSRKIKKMLSAMEKERDEKNTPFSILGSDSAFSGGGHNCFTWAHSYFKEVGIDLGRAVFGFFFTQTKSYTQNPEYYLLHPEYPKI